MKKIAIILSGGNGTRIKSSNVPKQFIKINNKIILFYSLETFYKNKNIDEIVVVTNSEYANALKKLLSDSNMDNKIHVVNGGSSRNRSLSNAIKFIRENLNVQDDDIILSHDAVRIFVSEKIINNNIEALVSKKADVVFTGIKTPDTIGFYNSNNIVFNIPKRESCFKGQTPQSANWKTFKEVYYSKYDDELFDSTDFCKLAEQHRKKIIYIEGSEMNFKITTDFDLMIAKKIIESN